MSLRDDFQPKWKLLLKWGWLSFAVFILMAPTFYTVYISFNELGFGAKYYNFTFQWYENVFSDKQLTSLREIGKLCSLRAGAVRHITLFSFSFLRLSEVGAPTVT